MSDRPIDRKSEILDELHGHLRRRIRRRKTVRVASTAGVVLLAGLVSLRFIFPTSPAPLPKFVDSRPSEHPAVEPVRGPGLLATHTQTGSEEPASRVTLRIARHETLPSTPCDSGPAATLCILSDDQLLAALAEAGQPSGLVRTSAGAYVVPLQAAKPISN